MKKTLASAKDLIYDNNTTYFCILLEIIYAVAENDVASIVNQKLRGGVHMTPIRYKRVLNSILNKNNQTYIFGRDNRPYHTGGLFNLNRLFTLRELIFGRTNFHEKIFQKKNFFARFNFREATKSRYFARINFREMIMICFVSYNFQ